MKRRDGGIIRVTERKIGEGRIRKNGIRIMRENEIKCKKRSVNETRR